MSKSVSAHLPLSSERVYERADDVLCAATLPSPRICVSLQEFAERNVVP